jgi:hypothetical protein
VYALVSNLEFYLLLLGWVLMGWVLWDRSRDHRKDRKRRAHARISDVPSTGLVPAKTTDATKSIVMLADGK